MKTYLITGGSGFIGSHFIEKIIKNKNNFVLNLDIKKDNIFEKSIKNNYKFIKGNILNKNLIKEIIENNKPNYIVNFAAHTHVDKSIGNPIIFMKNNVNGTLNLLEALKECNFKERFVHISTDEVYGSLDFKDKPFDLESKIYPKNPYSISKATSDFFVNYFHEAYKIDCIITRCSNNFGERQYPEKLIPLTIMKCLNKKKIPIYGTGENIRDWLYVKDHCEGIFKALKKGKSGEIYLFGGSNQLTNLSIVKKITKYFNFQYNNFDYNNLIEFVRDRVNHDKRYEIDFSKSTKELNYIPSNEFDKYFNNTIKFYIDNFKHYNKIMKKAPWFRKNYE